MKSLITFLLAVFVSFSTVQANNIRVTNMSLTGQVTTGLPADHYSFVKFDLSWDNSWRVSFGPSNWDAAWIFIKYRVNNGNWTHCRLNYDNGTNDGHTVPANVAIRTENNGLPYGIGAFIHRAVDGTGNVNWQNIQIRWNYGLLGVGDNDLVDIQVFAIEMVYVPQGTFYVGTSLGFETAKFYTYPLSITAYQISSESEIPVGTTNGNLYYAVELNHQGDGLGPIPAAFPKGFNAFYCMKYEMSEIQWVSFFNTLTPTQKANRNITDLDHKNGNTIINGNTITWNGTGDAYTTAPDRAVGYLYWPDGNAYLDWAALRPMTELEYEKACRGTLATVAGEFAWGNINIYSTEYSLTGTGSQNENISNPGTGIGNAIYDDTKAVTDRLLRCGIFASSSINKTREETGGSYYGVMELSGNMIERTVSVGIPSTRLFNGFHGNGVLSTNGDGNVPNWPILGGYRGGGASSASNSLRVSNRSGAASTYATGDYRGYSYGPPRGVRTAN